MPVAQDLKWIGFEVKKILVFPRAYFNLEFERAAVAFVR